MKRLYPRRFSAGRDRVCVHGCWFATQCFCVCLPVAAESFLAALANEAARRSFACFPMVTTPRFRYIRIIKKGTKFEKISTILTFSLRFAHRGTLRLGTHHPAPLNILGMLGGFEK